MEKPVTSRSDPESRRAYTRWHYQQNQSKYKARAVAFRRAKKPEVHRFICDYLREHPCVDCGEPDIIVLEFDHQKDKSFNLGDAMSRGVGLKTIAEEISKCVVRCANCHRKKTYVSSGFTHRS